MDGQKKEEDNTFTLIIKQMQEELRQSRERYFLLSDNIADVIWTMDIDLNFTYISKSVDRLLNYSPEEIMQTGKKKLLTPVSYRSAVEAFNSILKNTGCSSQVLELEHIKKDGSTIWTEVKVNLLHDTTNKIIGLLGITRDITDQKKAGEEKNKLETRLMKTQRLEAIGTLAGGVAHDFNNILTTILGYCELIMKDMDESNTLFGDLKQIRMAAARGESLVRQLLIFSRKQQMQFASVNVNTIISDLLKMLHRLIGEDIAISTDLDPAIWSIKADAGRIEQLIMNLAVNARDAMPHGGQLTIKTENISIRENQYTDSSDGQPGNYVRLSVADSGTGINKEIIDKIFEPFFTTKSAVDGAGLGLSTVYGIVRQHKGWITVDSEEGLGAAFKVYFPAGTAKLKNEVKAKKILEKFQGNLERILLVEDDAAIREVTSRTLIKNNYVVCVAETAEEALAIFQQENNNFHLVMSDVVLPNKSGIELVSDLVSQKPALKIILSSGYTDDKSHWQEIRKKGYRFLRKPYSIEELLKNIKMALQYG